jgi:hypothetical protein
MGMRCWNFVAITKPVSPNMRLRGRAVNKVPGLSPNASNAMMRCRAAQLWR